MPRGAHIRQTGPCLGGQIHHRNRLESLPRGQAADSDETFEAGDAYAVGPGHTPRIFAGTEVVEFTPTDELAKTMEVVARNMENAG